MGSMEVLGPAACRARAPCPSCASTSGSGLGGELADGWKALTANVGGAITTEAGRVETALKMATIASVAAALFAGFAGFAVWRAYK